ncbi:hypothetical protein [Paranoxybacillus vitaminiphilus]|nr:hypothetical protein [Anoxybacillus vitaminiphilus]
MFKMIKNWLMTVDVFKRLHHKNKSLCHLERQAFTVEPASSAYFT